MKKLCGILTKRPGMSEERPCIRKSTHGGWHSPDLTEMQFGNMEVVGLKRAGNPSTLWIVRRGKKLSSVRARDLLMDTLLEFT